MTDPPTRQDNLDYFSGKYSETRSRTARQVERVGLGHEVGLNGYTTLDQAQALCSRWLGPVCCWKLGRGAGGLDLMSPDLTAVA